MITINNPRVLTRTPYVFLVHAVCEVAGTHRWADAPLEYAYLSAQHRHMFEIQVTLQVPDSDRAIEANWLQTLIEDTLRMRFRLNEEGFSDMPGHLNFGGRSCEQVAEYLFHNCELLADAVHGSILVLEDGRNGGGLTW